LGVTSRAGLLGLALLPTLAFFVGRACAGAVATGFSGVFDAAVFDAAVFEADAAAPPPPDSPFAASLSVFTAFSRAFVAAVIAASAVVSAFADVPARVAARFSLAVADVTLVAAAETVRGVTVAGPLPAPLLAVVLPTLVLLAVARTLAVLVVPVVPVVPGWVAAVFVDTDLHPHLGQLRGWHSTESNALHLIIRKNSETPGIKVTESYFSADGRSPATIRSASSGDAPRPTATPIR
jgi:hypothetical protein